MRQSRGTVRDRACDLDAPAQADVVARRADRVISRLRTEPSCSQGVELFGKAALMRIGAVSRGPVAG